MNVLQILPELNAGGVERTTVEMVEALTGAGHGAHILSAGGRMVADIEALGGVHHTGKIGSKNILSVPWRIAGIRRLVVEHKIDLIHARSRAPAWPGMFAARAEKIPFVTTYHGIYKASGPLKRFYNSIMARGDAVIANSNFTRDYLIDQHGTDKKQITVIPRGVDMAQFDPTRIDRKSVNTLRENWGVDEEDIAVVLPGRLTRWKGQMVAIEALAHLHPKYHLILVGDPQGREAYVNALKSAAELHRPDHKGVVFAPHTKNMPALLMAADIVLAPSTEPEAFGRIAAEAQAMNRPIITTDHGGSLETVLQGKTGWRVPPSDAQALAEAILKADALSGVKTARERIATDFSKSNLQQAVLKLYENCLDSAGN